MNKEYDAKVELLHNKLLFLSVTHTGSQWTSISIKDPMVEIPLIISALQCHLTSSMHSDGESMGVCPTCKSALSTGCKLCGKFV